MFFYLLSLYDEKCQKNDALVYNIPISQNISLLEQQEPSTNIQILLFPPFALSGMNIPGCLETTSKSPSALHSEISSFTHNAMHLLHTSPRLRANKHTRKYTERHSETAAPYEAGPLWGLKWSLRVRGASERYGGAGSFEELISLTTLDTALFHSVHFIMTSWHHLSLSLSLSLVSACDPSTFHLHARFMPLRSLWVDPYGLWRARTMYDRPEKSRPDFIMSIFLGGMME